MKSQKTKLNKYVGFLLLWIISFTVYSQRTISGRIVDAENDNPIPRASVFISNTTYGITTDSAGHYRLKIPGEGSYRLMVSHVGYQTAYKDIEPGKIDVVFDVSMYSMELEELTVSTGVRFRQSDINLFWKTILGKQPSPKTIHAMNPEAAYYYFNPDTKILKVTCHKPLQIVNFETGYHILYVLEYFKHDYNTNTTEWSYQPGFTELEPENDRQRSNWKKKRNEVYQVSLTKFIKSLYNNSLKDDGFVLATLRQTDFSRNHFQFIPLPPDLNILTNSENDSNTLNLPDIENEWIMLVCYGRPVNDVDLEVLNEAINVSGKWSNAGLFRNLVV